MATAGVVVKPIHYKGGAIMPKNIEEIISSKLTGDAQTNALALAAHIMGKTGKFAISMHDENDESGWVVADLGFIMISGTSEFPGPWTMWISAANIGAKTQDAISDCTKEFAWKHVSPCGSCGGTCTPGVNTSFFGKAFENTCQANLMFTNPDTDAVDGMKKIIDIIASEL